MVTTWFMRASALALGIGLLAPSTAWSMDGEDDFLDDFLDSEGEETVQDEQNAIRSGDMDDRIGVDGSNLPSSQASKERLIKTLQKKTFMKLNRVEVTPNVGFVANDPFLNRYMGGVGIAYHFTEIFAFETNLGYSPDLGTFDWKPLTTQLVEENHVSPDLSKLSLFGNGTFQFSPIYGKVAWGNNRIINFDIFGAFGIGVVQTKEDLEALDATGEGSDAAEATQIQFHPTTNFGGGFRVIFGENLAFRLDARSLVYIETVSGTTLEMKNNFILSSGMSFFFPGMD